MKWKKVKNLSPKLKLQPAWQELQQPSEIRLEGKSYSKITKTIVRLPKRELKKQVNNIIKATKLGAKEKSLVRFLSDKFNPKTKEEIILETKSKAPIRLVSTVRRKLKGTDFDIKTNLGNFTRNTTYELKYHPSKKQ